MLSLVLGSEITDASVAAIASSYSNLELLDLSGFVLKLLDYIHLDKDETTATILFPQRC